MVLYCFWHTRLGHFFILHTIFTWNKSSSNFSFRNILPCNITSRVQLFIHCHKFSGLFVNFLQFVLIPLKYSSTTPYNGDWSSVQCHYHFYFHLVYSSKSILSSWNTHSWAYLSFLSLLFCHTPISPGIYVHLFLFLLSFHYLIVLTLHYLELIKLQPVHKVLYQLLQMLVLDLSQYWQLKT